MTFPRPDRAVLWTAVCAAIYALAAFAVHVRWFPIGDLGVESDFYAELVVSAQRLADGRFAVANHPFKGPLYSFLLVGVHGLAGPLGADWYRSAVLLNALCAAATLVVLFRLQRRLFGLATAVATTAALALTYEFFLHAHKASSDLLYLLLFLATVSAVIAAAGTSRRQAWAGGLAGLAFLCRYSGGVLVVAALAVHWLLPAAAPDGSRAGPRLRARRSGAFLLGFLLVCAPWFALNLAETGRPVTSGNLTNVVQEFYGGDRAALIPADGFDSLGEVVARDPAHFASRLAGNVPRHLAMDMTLLIGRGLWPLVAAGALGLLGAMMLPRAGEWARRRRPNREQWAFFVFAGCSFLAMCLVFHRPRFSLPLVPAYFTLGYALLFGFDGRPVAGRRTLLTVAVLLAAAVSARQVVNIVGGERYYHERRPLEVLRRAPGVRDLAARTGARTLMAGKPHLAHYAGLEHRMYPGAVTGWDGFLGTAFDQGVDLIVVGGYERSTYPDAAFLELLDRAAGVARAGGDGDFVLFHLDRGLSRDAALAVPAADSLRRRIREADAVDDGPAAFGSHSELAVLLMPLGLWDEAATSLAACLELAAAAPGAVSAADRDALKVNLAYCRWRLGDYDAGIALLGDDLGELAPSDDAQRRGLRHFVLARLLAGAERYEEARRHFHIARDLYREGGFGDTAAAVTASLAAIEGR